MPAGKGTELDFVWDHGIIWIIWTIWIFPVAQTIKILPAVRETRVWSLGGKDCLEKGIAIHSSTLTWRIPWTEETGRPQSRGLQRVGHDWVTNTLCKRSIKQTLLFWKEKQNWCTFSQIYQEQKQTQINKIRSEIGEIITDTTDIQKMIREHYEQLSANKIG